jgi:hypothetical protein
VAALLITTHSATSIISNHTPDARKMTAFLHKSKVVLLEHMKSIPDAPAADNEGYVILGHRFIDITVSRKLIGGGCN